MNSSPTRPHVIAHALLTSAKWRASNLGVHVLRHAPELTGDAQQRHTRLAFDVVADNLHGSGIIPVTLGDAGSLPARAGQRYGGNA